MKPILKCLINVSPYLPARVYEILMLPLNLNKMESVEYAVHVYENVFMKVRVITKLPNSEQSYKRKVKTHM